MYDTTIFVRMKFSILTKKQISASKFAYISKNLYEA